MNEIAFQNVVGLLPVGVAGVAGEFVSECGGIHFDREFASIESNGAGSLGQFFAKRHLPSLEDGDDNATTASDSVGL